MKKVFWFSRHEMTSEQKKALGEDIEVFQCNKEVGSAWEVAAEMDGMDIIAIVAPIGLQAQFLKIAGNRPVITAVSKRVLVRQDDGTEEKVAFVFEKWERILKIDVVKEDYVP